MSDLTYLLTQYLQIFVGYGNPLGGCHPVVHSNTAFYKVTSSLSTFLI